MGIGPDGCGGGRAGAGLSGQRRLPVVPQVPAHGAHHRGRCVAQLLHPARGVRAHRAPQRAVPRLPHRGQRTAAQTGEDGRDLQHRMPLGQESSHRQAVQPQADCRGLSRERAWPQQARHRYRRRQTVLHHLPHQPVVQPGGTGAAQTDYRPLYAVPRGPQLRHTLVQPHQSAYPRGAAHA